MSVQNPERVVTKQDLADFYEQILPYLGGMPEILANKFSKGDLYSTDEKMIGQWVNGKPLYQKSIQITLTGSSNWEGTNHNISNMDECIESHGWVEVSNEFLNIPHVEHQATNTLCVTVDASKIYVLAVGRTGTAYATVKYTKTTDSAIAIGTENEYSTTEKIVGTWIDGSPIYQKTIDLGSDTTVNAGNWTNITSAIIEDGIHLIDTQISRGDGVCFSGVACSPFGTVGSDKCLQLRVAFETNVRYITIQYVKATS